MADVETQVSAHYTTEGLLDRIEAALEAAGADPKSPRPEDLKGVDEFHTGGVLATDDLLAQLAISADMRVLDVGCGIGGTARHIASATGAHVTGFDLTDAYVAIGRTLTERVGLADQVTLLQGSALSMPVGDGSHDLATMFHVGMNLPDKSPLMAEMARVVRPGGTVAIFDVMRAGAGNLTFPFPWAEDASFSFVDAPGVYKDAAKSAGLELVKERSRADFALTFFENVFAAIAERGGPPPVGIHLLMRETAAQKIENYVAEVKAGRIAPVELIFRVPE